jgi:hypothetical protein
MKAPTKEKEESWQRQNQPRECQQKWQREQAEQSRCGRRDSTRRGRGVDLDRLVASRMLIQANSGGGKSRAIRQLLEETHGRVQHLVLDPEGEFATLRERFDYVLAGKEGDVQATPKTAKLLCRRLVELGRVGGARSVRPERSTSAASS